MSAACLSTCLVKRPPDIGRFEVKKTQRLSLLTVMIAVIASGCRTGKNPRPSSTAVEQIPKQPNTISAPTSTAGEQNPTLPTATHPILADTQIRPIDGMEMGFVENQSARWGAMIIQLSVSPGSMQQRIANGLAGDCRLKRSGIMRHAALRGAGSHGEMISLEHT